MLETSYQLGCSSPWVVLLTTAIVVFVHYSAWSAGRQNLERLEELDHVVSLCGCERLERDSRRRGLAVVTKVDLFAHRREPASMPKGPLVVEAPEFSSDELSISCKEPRGTCRLVLVERLGIGIRWAVAQIVKLE